jgi:hypothetical protein
MTEPTAPVTNTSPAATGGASGSSSAPASSAGKLAPFGMTGSMMGGIVGLIGVVVGGGWVLI